MNTTVCDNRNVQFRDHLQMFASSINPLNASVPVQIN